MLIKNFVLNIKSRKLWIVILMGIVIALGITTYTFIEVSSKDKKAEYLDITKILKKDNVFNMQSYHTEYEVTVLSNKNRSVYNMKEWYTQKKESQKSDSFKFEYLNSENNPTIYILKDNTLQIKNVSELNKYLINDYIVKKENLLSISTFVHLYSKIVDQINLNKTCKCCWIENKVENEKIYSRIFFTLNNAKAIDCDICKEYSAILSAGLSVYTIELVIDKKTEIPIELNIYSDKSKIWMAVTYKSFNINPKFDEKVFSF
ncbi:MAG: hypothetical protein N2749_04170 [Clostridia bacterium]|nr:hypothetical protein [Clostridia bacterium]